MFLWGEVTSAGWTDVAGRCDGSVTVRSGTDLALEIWLPASDAAVNAKDSLLAPGRRVTESSETAFGID